MPEPFVMPPTWNVPAAVSTFTAASLGNGSVVMIASIALRCASRLSAAIAFVTPSWTFSRLRSTPMTPVEATSTSSGRHPIWRATNSTVERATAMPASPVHAFAHPLLQTIGFDPSAGSLEVRARDENGRRLRLVRREHSGGGDRAVGSHHHHVERPGVRRRLDAGIDTGGPEACRRCDAALDCLYSGVGASGCVRHAIERWAGPQGTSRSVTIANCSHRLKSGQLRQSAMIFSGSQVCGTIEKPMCAKYAG